MTDNDYGEWHIEGRVASYWEDGEAPSFEIWLPSSITTLDPEVRRMLVSAFEQGKGLGEKRGRAMQKSDIRHALGIKG